METTTIEDQMATEAYRSNNRTIRVPLTWLMKNATQRSIDGFELGEPEGWARMLERKCSDTGFGRLLESIMEHGLLREGPIGFSDGEITEGHHRLCAAILLGLDEVYVSAWGRNADVRGKRISGHNEWDDPDPRPIYLEV